VLIDGELVNSCLVPLLQVDGANVTTIEGVSAYKIQKAFIDQGGAQCGICTPGMIMATVHLLKRNPNPDEQQIRDGLAGNLCRCTGYTRIFEAVREAIKPR
jgi:aerobic carbon-monoxide dehydrogenase small subunit